MNATPESSRDRPTLVRRIAQEYVELACAAERDWRAGDTRSQKPLILARKTAIRYYQQLTTEYSTSCQSGQVRDPSKFTACLDEALYGLALLEERAGDLNMARSNYLKLIQMSPHSPRVPLAYFAFGELFLAEAETDPSKLALAELSYREVVKVPAPANVAYGFALLRMGKIRARQHDDAGALNYLQQAIAAPARGDNTALVAAAKQEAIAVFARSGNPADARSYFTQLTTSSAELEDMLAELARRRTIP